MQSVLNFSSPLRHTLIVGAPCSGKDFLTSHAIKTLKQQQPFLTVYVIDFKGDPKESHYYACADFFRTQNSTTIAAEEDVDQLVSWIQHCFTEFESIEGKKLLVLSESTLIFHFFALNKSNRTWLANKIINYLCLGNANGIYIWLIGTTLTIENIGISSTFKAMLKLILIIHGQSLPFYNHILGTNCFPKNCRLSIEAIGAIAQQSPLKRAVYHDGEWLPMLMLDS
jgi:hypothetical protein